MLHWRRLHFVGATPASPLFTNCHNRATQAAPLQKMRWARPIIVSIFFASIARGGPGPTIDDGAWFVLPESDVKLGAHHTRHAEVFGKYLTGYNAQVLAGVDKVQ